MQQSPKSQKRGKGQKISQNLWKRMVIAHSVLDIVDLDSSAMPLNMQRRLNALAHSIDDWAKSTQKAIDFIEGGVQDG